MVSYQIGFQTNNIHLIYKEFGLDQYTNGLRITSILCYFVNQKLKVSWNQPPDMILYHSQLNASFTPLCLLCWHSSILMGVHAEYTCGAQAPEYSNMTHLCGMTYQVSRQASNPGNQSRRYVKVWTFTLYTLYL